jgi:hypothetical protein
MKKLLTLFLFTMLSVFSYGQDSLSKVVCFHPVLGNLVDRSEKQEYDIFTEYTDSLFESAQLFRAADSSYTIVVKTSNGQSFQKSAGTEELDAIYHKVENTRSAQKAATAKQKAEERREKERKAQNTAEWVEFGFNMFFISLEVLAWAFR